MVAEQRQSIRKILKTRALVALEGQAPRQVRTADISANGVSITVAEPMQAGQTGQVSFDLLVDGKSVPVAARVRSMYCVFSSGEFKVGFQFLNLELSAMSQLARFLR